MPCNNRVRPDIKFNCNMGVIGVFREFAWFKRHNVIRFCTYKILNMNKKIRTNQQKATTPVHSPQLVLATSLLGIPALKS